MVNRFKKILIANRGEISIRIARACKELGIRSIAIYSEEDKNSLFRTKADESYLIGEGKTPIGAYLAIDEIIEMAKAKGADAIHPGYGFLSENVEFAKACEDAGIVFIGPDYKMMGQLGDKIQSKLVAQEVGVPTIPGVEEAIPSEKAAKEFAEKCGYPVMLKAAAGGGGRGMRIVHSEEELIPSFRSALSEAKKAFGIDDIFIEKYLESPKHIEVQILGDNYGNLVHLYERDCSIQRRHQKVVEFTPALCLDDAKRKAICEDALKIAKFVNYRSAGTVEFLLDKHGNHYFIEMNPRIQVEHTVTEMTTGIDIVHAQIMIASGCKLGDDEIGIKRQEDVKPIGAAIQCRITTEDPANDFAPDTGTINLYRSASGFGIRLDGGNGFTGAVISPYYDSLLVKITSYARTFEEARKKSLRALSETKIKGVKTNMAFLANVLNHEKFKEGNCDTGFIAENPELLNIRPSKDRERKLLTFIAEKVVNDTKGVKPDFDVPVIPNVDESKVAELKGTKQLFDDMGAEKFSKWITGQEKLLITDTTMRDAQQSLMATRVRSLDMEKIATATAIYGRDLFSYEMWGGATFDVAYRFLKEDPWERLDMLRQKMPNTLTQMLIRGANAVGYKNYPDNVIRRFIQEAAKSIDIFRIFDSLNWIEGMTVSLDEVLKQGKIAEPCLCYTGDVLDGKRTKYNLDYYVRMAKELEKRGAHILGIKDMAGLVKPHAAKVLIDALKNAIDIPIHFHTHDTSGNAVAAVLMAAEAGVDIADAAYSSMAGLTSQPSLNSIVAAVQNTPRDTGIDLDESQRISDYWSAVRPIYSQFESDLLSPTAEIYKYEIPGGQYSNLKPQVESFGLGHKFYEVKEMYKKVNEMLGDIIKVTPSSKVVGDLAIFMIQNELTPENVVEKGKSIDFPDSAVSYFEGMIGQPEGGFPKDLQEVVLKGKKPITCRPGELLEDENFDEIKKKLQDEYDLEGSEREALSYALYPKVFEDYIKSMNTEGSFRYVGSDVFFHGMKEGEVSDIKIAEGKELTVKLIEIKAPDVEGFREVLFEVNGNRSNIKVLDKDAGVAVAGQSVVFAAEDDPYEVGANIPGKIVKVLVADKDEVKEGDPIAIIEAMKMESNILATANGIIDKIYVEEGKEVKANELIVKIS